MKNELRNIIKSDSFLEYKRLENKIWNADKKTGGILAILGYIVFLIVLILQFFQVHSFGEIILVIVVTRLLDIF